MKKLLFLIFIFNASMIFAQDYTELGDDYFVDYTNIENANIYIRKYSNPELSKRWWEAQKRYAADNNKEDLAFVGKNIKEASKSEIVKFKKGEYLVNNSFEKFGFVIDNSGNITGIAKRLVKKDYAITDFMFENGNLVSAVTNNIEEKPIKKITITDDWFTEESYKDGELARNRKVNRKRSAKEGNEITTYFFSNGKVEYEQNSIDKTFKTFYENGNPKLHRNDAKYEETEYAESGKKIKYSYDIDGKRCFEEYENGIIARKNCDSSDKLTSYFYHYNNGKLQDYEILDRNTDKIKKYDKNNKLLKVSEAGKLPMMPK